MSPEATLLAVLVAAAAIATLRWPMAGVCAIVVLDFLRPQDTHPALGSMRPMVWLAAATLAATLWQRRTELLRSTRPLRPLLAVLAVTALSAAASEHGALAWGAWVELAKAGLLMALIVANVDSPRRVQAALWCIAGSIGVLATGAILRAASLGYPSAFTISKGGIGGPTGEISAAWPEGNGPMRDNNAFARVLVMGLPANGALWAGSARVLSRLLALASGAATLVAIMLTFSRTGFVAAVAVTVLAVLQTRPRRRAVAVLVALAAAAWLATPKIYRDRAASISLRDGSLQLRYGIWSQGLEMAASRPLLGVGIGTFAARYSETAPPPPRSAHNVFVEVLAETGGLGLAAYLWLVGAALWRLWRVGGGAHRGPPAAAAEREWPAAPVARGLAIALVGHLVASTTLSHAYSSQLLTALALAYALTWRREQRGRDHSAGVEPGPREVAV